MDVDADVDMDTDDGFDVDVESLSDVESQSDDEEEGGAADSSRHDSVIPSTSSDVTATACSNAQLCKMDTQKEWRSMSSRFWGTLHSKLALDFFIWSKGTMKTISIDVLVTDNRYCRTENLILS